MAHQRRRGDEVDHCRDAVLAHQGIIRGAIYCDSSAKKWRLGRSLEGLCGVS